MTHSNRSHKRFFALVATLACIVVAHSQTLLNQFKTPPKGYGEVPFYWWSGDKITRDRLLWQLDQLHEKGVSGVQVNYAHQRRSEWGGGGHGMTYPSDPTIFSKEWWELWRFAADACAERGMGIGLGDYTLAWAGNKQWVDEMIVGNPEVVGRELHLSDTTVHGNNTLLTLSNVGGALYLRASNKQGQEINLLPTVQNGIVEYRFPVGEWKITAIKDVRMPRSINPLHPLTGKLFIEKYFQRFVDKSTHGNSDGLNYFFQDELWFGVEGFLWSDEFADVFRRSKGYDILPELPHLFREMDNKTPKIRLDYYDVMVRLSEEYYFKPVFDWHNSRGMIYGCDQEGRGLDPLNYGDYFRAISWFTAPGHDTPGIGADLIKGKVSSSVAHLYKRPRVWLEGYHSAGWGTSTETLTRATCENYVFGTNLLCLHGLYYSTFGSSWEWAPPCYHFRMPYWKDMGAWLKYFERLSYIMSQGQHHCDVAMLYPVEPLQAGIDGQKAVDVAFETGRKLYPQGIDFDFIDFQSISNADVTKGVMEVSDESYQAVILPQMSTLRYETVEQLLKFYRNGGIIVAVGSLPIASDRAGKNDPALASAWKEIFGSATPSAGTVHKTKGTGLLIASPKEVPSALAPLLRRDFAPVDLLKEDQKLYVNHRKADRKDIFMVMYAEAGKQYRFRTSGTPSLWNPWNGTSTPLYTYHKTGEEVCVTLPPINDLCYLLVFDSEQGDQPSVTDCNVDLVTSVVSSETGTILQGIAFSSGDKRATVHYQGKSHSMQATVADPLPSKQLQGDWTTRLLPTMDNRWGDFFLPASPDTIGAQTRKVRYTRHVDADWMKPSSDESRWTVQTVGFHPALLQLTLPDSTYLTSSTDALVLNALGEEPKMLKLDNHPCVWQPYYVSPRFGHEGNPGPQGFHGNKGYITRQYIQPSGPSYFMTRLLIDKPTEIKLTEEGLRPSRVWIDGELISDLSGPLPLTTGTHTLLIRYDQAGSSELLARDRSIRPNYREYPLAMESYLDRSVIPFTTATQSVTTGYYRFDAPPGARSMKIRLYGMPEFYHDGTPCTKLTKGAAQEDGSTEWTVTFDRPQLRSSLVAMKLVAQSPLTGGAAIPAYIDYRCGEGRMAAGDWSKVKGMEYYSGGVSFTRTASLTNEECSGRVMLDLGQVVASCEVYINGKKAGELTTAPWSMEVSPWVKPGENTFTIVVYNTLANHYQTIPTDEKFKGNPQSGFLAPLQLRFDRKVEMRSK